MDLQLLLFILVGFFAEIIDGTLGMAYGVSANTFLLSTGVSPAIASASVHASEIFTTAVSGLSHLKAGNVDSSIFKKLVIPGIFGGVFGAYILTNVPGESIKPFVSAYLLIMGIIIIFRAFQKRAEDVHVNTHTLSGLGLIGGVFDAIGGGGWGPIVTTTLIAQGKNPRKTIGSVNLAEFFVTFAEAVTFFLTIGLTNWKAILGLMIGGVMAAPLGAYITKKVNIRALMIIVGCLIIFLSGRTICQAWF